MQYYEFENYQIAIPKMFGTEVTKNLQLQQKKRFYKKWTNNNYFEELKNTLNPNEIEIVKFIHKFSHKNAVNCKYGNGKTGTFLAVYKITGHITTYSIDTSGEFWIYAECIENENIKNTVVNICEKYNFRKTKKNYYNIEISQLNISQIKDILTELKPYLIEK